MGGTSMAGQVGTWFADKRPNFMESCARLIYTSRATEAFDDQSLSGLVKAAHVRNASEKVTGCLVYDNGRFLQWLEGPSGGIERISDSIRVDRRHTDIEIIDERSDEQRVFSDWSMRLLVGQGIDHAPGAVTASRALIERLHRPSETSLGLAELLRSPSLPDQTADMPRGATVGDAGPKGRIWPHQPAKSSEADANAIVSALDGALLGDIDRVCRALRPRICERRLAARTVAHLLEAVVECIRAKWLDDTIAEYEATIAQCTALTAFRRIAIDEFHHPVPMRKPVLVATAPCETHLLQTALASETFAEVGFAATCEHPETVEQFEELMRSTCPRVVVLCMSGMFRRDERFPELEDIVDRARLTAGNRPLTVAALGRSFSDHIDSPSIPGTACACRSAPEVLRRLSTTDPSATCMTRQLPIPATVLERISASFD